MNTERKLIQQLRDEIVTIKCALEKARIWNGGGWTYNPLPAFAYTPAHEVATHSIAAADAYLSKQDWIRVEDALPVVPVPVEPTEAMITAGNLVGDYPWTEPKSLRVYKAMIAAAGKE